jgi:photosystem II stability/assembly factor-like uncharacterized protein
MIKSLFARLSLLVLLASAPLLFLFLRHKPENEKEENKERPAEHFAFMRSFPDASFDYLAFQKVLQEARIDASLARMSSSLSWQQEGPNNIGGRITALAIHPNNPNILFAGCPGGGMFKSTDAGASWLPVFDNQSSLAVSCIVFDPNNANVIYAGTGDPDTPFTCFIGDGVYKSTDGGNTWSNIGLSQMGIITQILVHPNNSQIMYVSSMGVPMARNLNRGVYKTLNGGLTWTQILSIDNQTGVSDLVMDFTNPNVIYAAAWSRIRTNTESLGFSNTTRLYKTTDAGSNWTIINNGLPNVKLSRFAICMSRQDHNKLYVAVCDSTYGLENVYVSNNAGNSFSALPGSPISSGLYGGFGWYFGKIHVKPDNDNDLLLSGVEHYRSNDGGNTFFRNQPEWWTYNPHADVHDIVFKSSVNYIIATDGGLYETADDGITWNKLDNIPNTQFYRVNFNPFNNDEYCGGAQDNGTTYGGITTGAGQWNREFGGDGFQPRLDPTNNQIRYAETQNGDLWVSNDEGISYGPFSGTIDAGDRRNWDMPYVFGGNSYSTMFTGTYRVYRNDDNPNENWFPISGDLTDGLIYAPRFHTISCIDHASLNTNYLYAGTSDGNVWRSLDGGLSWDSLHMNLPNRYVTSIHASPNVPNNVYVTHSGYRYNQYIPHIHKSTDNGSTWQDISGNLPQAGINDVVVAPDNENILFVATDIGVYHTTNGGNTWLRLGNNMPVLVVWDLEYNPNTQKLIAGTYARGLQTIDVSSLMVSTSAGQMQQENLLNIYPNPTSDFAEIVYRGTLIECLMYDAFGKQVMSSRDKKINLSALPAGAYLVKAQTDRGLMQQKIIRK